MHGRLYISQNWLCFYANIFGWETFVSITYKIPRGWGEVSKAKIFKGKYEPKREFPEGSMQRGWVRGGGGLLGACET